MAYPTGIILRPVTIGGATVLESGEQLSLVAEIKSSRGLMWGATGWQFHAVPRTITGNGGEELSFSLPVTDLTGWRLLDNPGSAIDVSAPNSYTHTYTIKLTTTLQGGRAVAVRTVGPFVLPAEDLSPVDLDLMLPVGTQAGGVVQVPDTWDAKVTAAEAAADAMQPTVDAVQTGRLSEASLSRYARDRGARVALLGDSITDQNAIFDVGASNFTTPGAGWFWWAKAALGGGLTWIGENGVSGNTTAQVLARVNDVIALAPDFAVVTAGTNDIHAASTYETVTANLAAIYDALNEAGIHVLAGEIPPDASYNNVTKTTLWQRVNTWIREQARARGRVDVVPWAGALTNPSTGAPASGVLRDGTHPNTTGAALMGVVLADVLRTRLARSDMLPFTNADPTNALTNGLMLGDSSGAATNLVLDGVTGTVTPTKVARTDGQPGEWQQLVLSAGSCSVSMVVPFAGSTAMSSGDDLVAGWEIDGDLTNFTLAQVRLRAEDSGGRLFTQSLGLHDSYSSPRRAPLAAAVFEPYVLSGYSAGATHIRIRMDITGTGTVRLGRAFVRRA